MADEPDGTTIEALRREAFEELGRVSMIADDYALKLFDATERQNLMETAGRLQQFRLCTINMIQTFNHFLRTQPHGQDVAEARSPHADGEHQRSSDGVA